jgi:hypothetical protein
MIEGDRKLRTFFILLMRNIFLASLLLVAILIDPAPYYITVHMLGLYLRV